MFKTESDKLKVPADIYRKYFDIIKLFDNLIYDSDNTKTLKNISPKYLNNLHLIAIEMYEFKQSGGNLQFAYDEEILIQKFFEKIITDTRTSELAEYVRSSLKELDNKADPRVGVIKPYQTLEKEYQKFVASNLDAVQNTCTTALESEKTLTQQFSFVRYIKQNRVNTEAQNCSLF